MTQLERDKLYIDGITMRSAAEVIRRRRIRKTLLGEAICRWLENAGQRLIDRSRS